jgi:hypothetical protein
MLKVGLSPLFNIRIVASNQFDTGDATAAAIQATITLLQNTFFKFMRIALQGNFPEQIPIVPILREDE